MRGAECNNSPRLNPGKSYTHLEYEYALEKEIPLFSCVLRDPDKRAMDKGDINKYLERDNPAQYKDFNNLVMSKMITFWQNSQDIKLEIFRSLNEFQQRQNMIGWVRSNQQMNSTSIQEEETKLIQKNRELEQL